MNLVHDVVKTLVKRATEHGLQFLAKALGMFGGFVSFESFRVLPHFDYGEMIRATVVLQQLEADNTGIFAAVRSELLQYPGAVGRIVWREIDVSHDKEPVCRRLGATNSPREKQNGAAEQLENVAR